MKSAFAAIVYVTSSLLLLAQAPAQTNITTPQAAIAFPRFDTAKGGVGQDVDGVKCEPQEVTTVHYHAHLSIYVNGKPDILPEGIGVVLPPQGGPCIYWLHTHSPSGLIHVEAHEDGYTLGNFFDVWGRPLNSQSLAGIDGPVRAYINGKRFDGDPGAIPLTEHADIVLEVGPPYVVPPAFTFPQGY